jgi:hypothetical protein
MAGNRNQAGREAEALEEVAKVAVVTVEKGLVEVDLVVAGSAAVEAMVVVEGEEG